MSTGVWFRRLRGALLVLVFVSAFLYIFSLNFRTPDKMDRLQRFVTEVASPPLQLVGKVFSSFEEFCKDYIWLRNLRTENETLKSRMAQLQNRLTSYQEAFIENQRLRRLLDFKKTTGYETVAAQVVVHDLTGWFQTLIVDKGFRDGVAADMPVVNEEGVIGRILDVSDRYSRVLLITDQGSAVDAIDERNRVRGILCGKDANGCLLKYVNSNLDMEEGDLMITSGKDGIFPKGLRLGIVHAVYRDPASMFQRIDVKPLVQLSTIEEVLIIKRGRIELGAVENAKVQTARPVSQKGSGKPAAAGVRANVAPKAGSPARSKHSLKASIVRPVAGGDKKTKRHRGEAGQKSRNEPRGQNSRGPEKVRR
jgi:rod shape-determining protein MreC